MFQWRGNPVFVSSFGNQRSLSPQHLIEIRSGEEEGEEEEEEVEEEEEEGGNTHTHTHTHTHKKPKKKKKNRKRQLTSRDKGISLETERKTWPNGTRSQIT